jgi:hypothetical protein
VRRFGLAAVTCLHGVVACGSIWGFEDPIPVNSSSNADGGDGGPVVDTPVAPGDPTRTCVPKPPADWQGPLIIFEGSGSPVPEAPSCLTGYRTDAVYDGNANLVAPDAACTCECGGETGGSCSGTLSLFVKNDCKDPCVDAPDQTIGAMCTPIKACSGARLVKTTPAPGSCAPNTIAKAPPGKPVWMSRARVCAPLDATQAGCPADRIATPTTGLPFTTNTYCIAKTGEDECPVATYPRKRVYYAGFNDARDCECTCAAPQGGTCTGSITAAASDCVTGPKAVNDDGKCVDLGATGKSAAIFVPGSSTAGTCAPQSKPKGNATPTTPTTICCTR